MGASQGHRLKNDESRLSKDLRTLKLESRFLLTGTPLRTKPPWIVLETCFDAFELRKQFTRALELVKLYNA